ncbi:DUF4062 domain-containing protein [Domibacillus aminovorans]|uniref:DUF4062 domain-containing protein n=1 Tax=Domibacillus aminovorans TaxID=29332 RepID=A0A177LD64_9BACI|nr:DUF4062 domain-containing protein [Domibacillus aminovorans]OAH63277.1 hypothetical protein AWH49_00015 [Domibacillus aminovorans]
MKKKLQIFISSTYIDLKDERQAAVEAILDAGHIPAGMELFKAGNEDQLKTIKRWIDESDVYLLILGGRYGSIETSSGKSYTHLEYEYAIEKGMPVFATVLSDSWLYSKAAQIGAGNDVFEQQEQDKYKQFKDFVHSKVIRRVEDLKDIKLSIHTTLSEFKDLYEFSGWVKGSEVEDNAELIKENRALLKENKKLKELLDKQASTRKVGRFEYEEIKEALKNKEITLPAGKIGNDEDKTVDYLSLLITFRDTFSTGVENSTSASPLKIYLYYNIAPTLMSFGLLEKVKVAGAKYERIHTTKEGLNFLAYYDIDKSNKKRAATLK